MADPITIASTAIGFLGNVFGATNPKDQERFAQTRRLRDAAVAGNEAAFWQLKCLSGDTSAETRAKAIQWGVLSPTDGACGYATDAAKADAKAAVGYVVANRTTAAVAGTVAAGATQIGLSTNPGVFTGTAGSAAVATLSPWLLVGGAVVLYLLLKRGK